MLNANTHLIGTIRKSRKGLPKEVVDAKLKKREIYAMENQDGVAIRNWRYQRNIIRLSTRHGSEMVEVLVISRQNLNLKLC
ncbi:hypothetical protein NQ314_005679 [Rhamnusium bicolor]|uniref:PiggyBac transposable element-derived protein domain-containing protein n=1 Tax=Rhamnusium bicolor TaxID=1586634 RepID=A0AAV8ZHA2_9CUCU|nr:hypothetical protein NQ314_005679 [Rhamnusium bicolor]